MGLIQKIGGMIVPIKKKPSPGGASSTETFQPSNSGATLNIPAYRDHQKDLFTERSLYDSRRLIKNLVKYDSDTSATLHAFLTAANTKPRFYVYDVEGQLDREAQKSFNQILGMLVRRADYSDGFVFTKSLREIAEDLRYMILLRGGCAIELVFDKMLYPNEIRQVDLANIEWTEKSPGLYKPQQKLSGSGAYIPLDIPNFFIKFYRQNPTEIYTESLFVSAINTIAARQQVINDLYRIMQKTGYPRVDVSVAEEILRKNAPAEMMTNEKKMSEWLKARMSEITSDVSSMRADAAYVHFDAIDAKILNERGPGSALDVSHVISVLDAQNQAALKTMGTIIGKGEGGVNTASVESRIFSMAADSLNGPIADIFSEMFTFSLRLLGYDGHVECIFDTVELRPDTELEAQRLMKKSRLTEDLSAGLITDDEYHIQMYGRIRPDSVEEKMGTGFYGGSSAVDNASNASPNSDPLGRSVTPKNNKSAKSNGVVKK